MARTSKITAVRTKKICAAIRAGMSRTGAAGIVGLHPTTITNWLDKGEDGDKRYVGFLDAYKKAEATFEQTVIGRISAASMDTWQAAAWLAERRFPQQWVRTERQEITHSGEVAVKGYAVFDPGTAWETKGRLPTKAPTGAGGSNGNGRNGT